MENVIIYDIETLRGMFLACYYEVSEHKWRDFEVSERRNDIYSLCKFLKEGKKDHYFVGYNNLNFDSQVIEYIIRNYEEWFDLTNKEVIERIYRKSQDVISDMNDNVFPPYREEGLCNKQIDLFKIHHFDNENRRCSLKWLEFMMDMPNIEEMPIHHSKDTLSEQELEEVKYYCHNDVMSTYQFYKYTTGDTRHGFYAGKNKIQDRLDIMETEGFDGKVLNYSDVKIGDEINKKGYSELTGVDITKLYLLKMKRKPTPKFTFGSCIPDYVKFSTPELTEFISSMKDVKVSLADSKQEFTLNFKGTTYTIARGGIHSNESYRIIEPMEGIILMDADIGSQYPNAIVKRGLYPSHLGKKWLVHYAKTVKDRIMYKKMGKEDRKYKSKADGLKLALNGGGYGKFNEKTSWQYDPLPMYKCTIGNQAEILMLIEMLELRKIHVVSANTDGITSLFEKDLLDAYYGICHQWEKIVGNDKIGNLEYTEYKKLVQESVNNYIAIKADGSVKVKGRFDEEVELHKNNSDKVGRIERIALQEYFVNGTPVEETIKLCTNIYKFCIGLKANRNYHYESTDPADMSRGIYQRVIRFYASNKGVRLYKVKNEGSDAPGDDVTKVCGEQEVTICNKMGFPKDFSQYNIDYNFYIKRAEEVIRNIKAGKKSKYVPAPPEQLSLF